MTALRALLASSLFVALACGGSTEENDTTTTEVESTSGGETDAETPPDIAIRTTTPVPVPQPAIAREELSAVLQQLWTKVEETVAIRPPAPPAENTLEAIQEWASSQFAEWIRQRVEAQREVEQLSSELVNPEHPHSVAERAVGAALFGYVYEDLVSGARGAPVPDEIAGDPELLEVYVGALESATTAPARRALDAYLFCAQHVAQELAETPWVSWGPYCYERAQDINAVYELVPPGQMQDPAAPPTEELPPPAEEPDEAEAEGQS